MVASGYSDEDGTVTETDLGSEAPIIVGEKGGKREGRKRGGASEAEERRERKPRSSASKRKSAGKAASTTTCVPIGMRSQPEWEG